MKPIYIIILIVVLVAGLAGSIFIIEKQGDNKKEFMTVKIFLSDSRFVNEPYFDCSRTITVERQVPKTTTVARAALEALLRGSTEDEINQGFISTINPGVRIQKLTIEGGLAKVDFDEQLEYRVGGSCMVAAIRAQIVDTLKSSILKSGLPLLGCLT